MIVIERSFIQTKLQFIENNSLTSIQNPSFISVLLQPAFKKRFFFQNKLLKVQGQYSQIYDAMHDTNIMQFIPLVIMGNID